MYRMAMEKLYKWKAGKHRKPLIIEGARQVGKLAPQSPSVRDGGNPQGDSVTNLLSIKKAIL